MAKRTDPAVRWLPSSESLMTLFRSLVDDLPNVKRRVMFGYPSATVNGNLFAILMEDRLALRLSPEDRAALLSMAGAAPFEPMHGHTWREYAVVPDALVASPDQLAPWIEKACDYTRSLPPKAAKGKLA